MDKKALQTVKLWGAGVFLASLSFGCATLRTNFADYIKFSDQPTRALMRSECNDQAFTTQGTVVCEQKAPSVARVSVKVPPLEGRVAYSNGELKKTEDFNWYPKEGFWIWKKKPVKDTWIELDLGEIAATFGDWPVALDIMAVDKDIGVIVTKGVMYHRVCNDQDIPCSKLVVKYMCAGKKSQTDLGKIGKCDRMAGTSQAFEVALKAPHYAAKSGGKIYMSVPRLGIKSSYTLKDADISGGSFKVEIPEVKAGPTLVILAMDWVDNGKTVQTETRVLVNGFSMDWTGLDSPHYMERHSDSYDWVKPVMADSLEVNIYQGQNLVKKAYGGDKIINFPKPKSGQVACGFAWQRASSDLTATCIDERGQEVGVP